MSDEDFKYWAFISYSHQDKAWGDWLHKTLETYLVPARLAGRASRDGAVPKRLYPVFRDREELPSSADLGDNIGEALRRSRYLVVICSPHSAPSRWVNEEIRSFKRLGREGRILALIVDGEPNASDKPESGLAECFPAALRHKLDTKGGLSAERVEPIAADARQGKDGRANAALKLIAGLLGVGYDELRQRERQRRTRRRIQWGVAAAGLAALALGAWLWQAERQLTAGYAERGREALLRGDAGAAALYLNEAYSRGLQTPAVRLMLGHALGLTGAPNAELALPGRSGIGAISPDGNEIVTFVHGPVKDKQAQWQAWDWRRGKALFGQPAGTAPIIATAFSPDGARLATASSDGTIAVYDSREGKSIFTVKDRPSKILEVAFTPDGRGLLAISDDPQASLWDAATGKLIEVLPGAAQHPRHPHFSADSRRLLSVSRDGRATVWDLQAKRKVLTLTPPHAPFDEAWFSGQERFIISFDQDGGSEMWDAASGKLIKTAAGGDSRERTVLVDAGGNRALVEDGDHGLAALQVQAPDEGLDLYLRSPLSTASGQYAIDLSRDGHLAAGSTLTATVNLWTATGGNPVATLTLPDENGFLYQLAVFPDGHHLAGALFYGNSPSVGRVSVWELPPWPRFMGSGIDGDMAGAISEAGDRLSAVGPDGSAEIWDRRDGRLLGRFDAGLHWNDGVFLDGSRLITAHREGGTVAVWDITSGKQIAALAPFKQITVLAFSPEAHRLFVSDGHAGCELPVDATTPCKPLPIQGEVMQAAYTPDGNTLAVLDAQVLVWDSAAGRLRATVATPRHAKAPNTLAISGDGHLLLTLYEDGTLDQVNLAAGTLLGSVQLPAGKFTGAALQADRQLAAVTIEHKVQVWDLKQPRLKTTLDSPATGQLGWYAFSPDGSLLAATDDDAHIGLYDVDSGHELVNLEGSGNGSPPSFSRDGTRLMQGLMGTLAIWDLPLESRPAGEIAAWLRCRVPRQLQDGKLVPATPDPQACAADAGAAPAKNP